MAGYSVTFSVVDNATKQINAINKQIAQMRKPMDDLSKASAKFIDVSGLGKITQGLRGVAGAAGEAFSSLARLVPILGTITGAATIGGIAALTKSFLDMGTQLERDADIIGTSTGQLQDMQNAVIAAGGSVDDMTNALKEVAKTTYDTVIGANQVAAVQYQRLGIAIRDQNGHLRDAADILPETLKALDQYTNAQERAQIANRLGGQALYELDETIQRSGKTLQVWMADARRWGYVLDPKELRDYRQAVGEMNLAFRSLGTVISGVVAEAIDPMLRDLSEWVHTHQPEIKKALEDLSKRFKEWYDQGGMEKLKAGLTTIGDIMLGIVNHAEAIAIAFATYMGVKAVLAVIQLVNALKVLNRELNTGMLGKISFILTMAEGTYQLGKDVVQGPKPEEQSRGSPKVTAITWGLHKLWNLITGNSDKTPPGTGAPPPGVGGTPYQHGGIVPGSYQHGGIVPINAHAGEMVLPLPISEGLQRLFMGGAQFQTGGMGGTGGPFARMSEALVNWLHGGTGYRPQVDLSQDTLAILTGMRAAGAGGADAGGGGGGGGGGGETGSPLGTPAPAPAGGPGGGTAPAPATGPGEPVPGGGINAPKGEPQSAVERALPEGTSGVPQGAADLIKKSEGLQLHRYSDVGHPAIGYGHDITPQEMSQGFIKTASGNVPISGNITKDQANAIFQQDYETRRAHLAKTVPGFSGLNQNQQGAITSYYYNTGRLPKGLAGNIAAGNMGAISQSIKGGIATAGGKFLPALGRRRAQEAQLFNSPVAPTPDTKVAGAPQNTPGGGGASGNDVVGQMVALAGTRGAAVREFLRDPQGKIARDPDLGLWCAEFTQAALRHMGITGPGDGKNLMAASFANYGQSVAYKDVQRGDVLVNRNLKHVGLATGLTRTNPETGAFEVQEISSNSIVNGKVTNLPGLRWRSDVDARRSPELALAEQKMRGAQGAPATLAQGGGAMPNGSVNVNITHRNPPSGTLVTASSSGNGINLGDPRIEHQEFSQP